MSEVFIRVEWEVMVVISKPPYRVPSMMEIQTTQQNGLTVASTFSGCGGSSLGYAMAGYKVVWASEFIPAARETYRANFPNTPLDARDIREVQASEILAATNMGVGDLDILDGSPPCSSFSTAGSVESGWGVVKTYSDTKQRTDDLFFEFIRILGGIQPKVFVAENVSGLAKGAAKGYFLEILARMKKVGYRVVCRMLDAQWLGVPQQRQRLIFVGVREDLNIDPVHPSPLPYRYSLREAIPWMVRAKIGGRKNTYRPAGLYPSATIVQSDPTVSHSGFFPSGGFCEAECDISRYAIGREYDSLAQGQASKKYFNLIRANTEKPSPCVTQTGGVLGAASVVHPTERRKYTIPELRRICGFPDDFFLTGSYRQQWERLGRAVPPVMMMHIARTIQEKVFLA